MTKGKLISELTDEEARKFADVLVFAFKTVLFFVIGCGATIAYAIVTREIPPGHWPWFRWAGAAVPLFFFLLFFLRIRRVGEMEEK